MSVVRSAVAHALVDRLQQAFSVFVLLFVMLDLPKIRSRKVGDRTFHLADGFMLIILDRQTAIGRFSLALFSLLSFGLAKWRPLLVYNASRDLFFPSLVTPLFLKLMFQFAIFSLSFCTCSPWHKSLQFDVRCTKKTSHGATSSVLEKCLSNECSVGAEVHNAVRQRRRCIRRWLLDVLRSILLWRLRKGG